MRLSIPNIVLPKRLLDLIQVGKRLAWPLEAFGCYSFGLFCITQVAELLGLQDRPGRCPQTGCGARPFIGNYLTDFATSRPGLDVANVSNLSMFVFVGNRVLSENLALGKVESTT